MKNKIFSVLVGLLAVFLGACSDDDDVLTTSSVHVNGGPLEESITPTSARVRIRLNETAGIGEVGICYGVQTDKSALLSYGDVLKVEKVDSVMYLDLTELESATTYSYVAYAKYENSKCRFVSDSVPFEPFCNGKAGYGKDYDDFRLLGGGGIRLRLDYL